MSCAPQTSYAIGGVAVRFPSGKKPFKPQFAVMSKTIGALSSGRNALLESPTGTGKTLALLCATLSWQDAELLRLASSSSSSSSETTTTTTREPLALAYEANASGPRPIAKRAKVKAAESSSSRRRKKRHTPIIYASRTHSQLAQVLGELRRTEEYHWRSNGEELRVATLASREHYCVHREVSRMPRGSKSEGCKSLLETSGCRHHRRMHLLAAEVPPVWDIEELCDLGREVQACPYFASRAMQKDAHIVVMPYNYVIDPCVRKSMDIELKGAIVVLDEAHNIEDVAREAASTSVALDDLEGALGELKAMASSGPDETRAAHAGLAAFVAPLLAWGRETAARLTAADYEREAHVWIGEEMAATLFRRCALRPDGVGELHAHLAAACAVEEGQAQLKQGERMSGTCEALLHRLFTVLQFMLGESMRHAGDYRVALQREKPRAQLRGRRRRRGRGDDDRFGGGGGGGGGVWNYTLNLWCLNAAVAFVPIATAAHSIVLTSGTLSPMHAFAGELGCPFPIRLEAPHVINTKRQLWSGIVGRGPGQTSLCATFRNADGWKYQDSLGRVVVSLVTKIPDGVLLFFPSYSLMDKVIERWRSTNVWTQMCEQKSEVLVEPRGSGDEWSSSLRSFRRGVASGSGAIFFGVCRGKLSEGIDFADRDARAVLIVGIPYPAFKDLKVKLKRQFEDDRGKALAAAAAAATAATAIAASSSSSSSVVTRHRGRRGRSGARWYEQQAFRALNQAVGRCIRHKSDFGAIIFLDERFEKDSSIRSLSKWLRNAVHRVSLHHLQAAESVEAFFERQAEGEKKRRKELQEATSSSSSSSSSSSAAEEEVHELLRSVFRGAPPGIEHTFPNWRENVEFILNQNNRSALDSALAELHQGDRILPSMGAALDFFESLVVRQITRLERVESNSSTDVAAAAATGAGGAGARTLEQVPSELFTAAFLELQAQNDAEGVDSTWGARVSVPTMAQPIRLGSASATAPIVPTQTSRKKTKVKTTKVKKKMKGKTTTKGKGNKVIATDEPIESTERKELKRRKKRKKRRKVEPAAVLSAAETARPITTAVAGGGGYDSADDFENPEW